MSEGSNLPFLPFADAAGRAAYFEAAYLKQLEVNKALEQRIIALERQAALNSKTSSQPPSSDGLKKPPAQKRTQSLRGKSDRKTGGQPGHKGKTLRQSSTPDHIIHHYPQVCDACGAALSASTTENTVVRQVVDLPAPPPPEVTEHRVHLCRCGQCDAVTRGGFPEGVAGPVQYGPRIAGIASYLQTYHCIPEERLSLVLSDLFGLSAVPATLARLIGRTADRLQPFAKAVCKKLSGPQVAVKHLDETGFRVAGKTQWLHVICSPLLSHFRVSSRRGDLLTGVCGLVVHDHWAPYFKMEGVQHALCNAHHLRELQALIVIEKEPWATDMKTFFLEAKAMADTRTDDCTVGAGVMGELLQRYDEILTQAVDFHEAQPPLQTISKAGKRRGRPKRRTGHNLALRLQKRKAEAIRFLTDPKVPFTNNEAERDLRMGKVRQKVSGCFRVVRGAEIFCSLRTVTCTARKQGWSVIETLMKPSDQLIAEMRLG
jgi:transposase